MLRRKKEGVGETQGTARAIRTTQFFKKSYRPPLFINIYNNITLAI